MSYLPGAFTYSVIRRLLPSMRDIYEIRRENLHIVLEENFGGSRKAMADKLGFDQPALLSRYLSTRPETAKNIGANLARKIEQRAGRPPNWLDTDHQTGKNFMVRETHPTGYHAQRDLDPELMMACIDKVREVLAEKGVPKTDPAWTEQSILAMAMKLYQRSEAKDVSGQRGLKKAARDLVEVPVAAASKKKH